MDLKLRNKVYVDLRFRHLKANEVFEFPDREQAEKFIADIEKRLGSEYIESWAITVEDQDQAS